MLAQAVEYLNLIGLGRVGVFVYFLFKSLHARIDGLHKLADEQATTLDAVRVRAEEMEALSASYKRAVVDQEEMLSIYKAHKNEELQELAQRIEAKDREIASLKLAMEEGSAQALREELRQHLALQDRQVTALRSLLEQVRQPPAPLVPAAAREPATAHSGPPWRADETTPLPPAAVDEAQTLRQAKVQAQQSSLQAALAKVEHEQNMTIIRNI